MKTIDAIYENGVFRPLGPVDLPEHSTVEFEPRIKPLGNQSDSSTEPLSPGLAAVYAILDERYESGFTDTAARHNEHQP